MLDKEKDKEGLTVLGRTLKEIEAGLERAFEEFLQEYPDISKEEAQKAWKAAGAPSRVEPWRRTTRSPLQSAHANAAADTAAWFRWEPTACHP